MYHYLLAAFLDAVNASRRSRNRRPPSPSGRQNTVQSSNLRENSRTSKKKPWFSIFTITVAIALMAALIVSLILFLQAI